MANIQEPAESPITAPEHATFNAYWSPDSPNRLSAQPLQQRHAWERHPRRINARKKTRTIWKRYELRKPAPPPVPAEVDEVKDASTAISLGETATPVEKVLKKLRTRKDDTGLTPKTKRVGVTAVAEREESVLTHKLPITLPAEQATRDPQDGPKLVPNLSLSKAPVAVDINQRDYLAVAANFQPDHLAIAAGASSSSSAEIPNKAEEAEADTTAIAQHIEPDCAFASGNLLVSQGIHHETESGPDLAPARRSRRRHTEVAGVVQNGRGQKSARLSLPMQRIDPDDASTTVAVDHTLPSREPSTTVLGATEETQPSISTETEQREVPVKKLARETEIIVLFEPVVGEQRKSIHAESTPQKRPKAGRRRASDAGDRVNPHVLPPSSIVDTSPTRDSASPVVENANDTVWHLPRSRGRPARRKTETSETLTSPKVSRRRRATTALDVLEVPAGKTSASNEPEQMAAAASATSTSPCQEVVTQTTSVLRSRRRRQTDFIPSPPAGIPSSRKRRASSGLGMLDAPPVGIATEVMADEHKIEAPSKALTDTSMDKREPRWSTNAKGRRKTDGSEDMSEHILGLAVRRASAALDSLRVPTMPIAGSPDAHSVEHDFVDIDYVASGPAIDKPATLAPTRKLSAKSRKVSRRRTDMAPIRVSRSVLALARRASVAEVSSHEDPTRATNTPSGTEHENVDRVINDSSEGVLNDVDANDVIKGQGEDQPASMSEVDLNARQTFTDDSAGPLRSPHSVTSEKDVNTSSPPEDLPLLAVARHITTLREESDYGSHEDVVSNVLPVQHETILEVPSPTTIVRDEVQNSTKGAVSLGPSLSHKSTIVDNCPNQLTFPPEHVSAVRTMVEDESSGVDNSTAIKVQLNDEDTDMLKDFLTRSKANKAAKIAEKASYDSRRDSDIVKAALASPRQPLESLDSNSTSPRKALGVSIETSLHSPSSEGFASSPTAIAESEGLALDDGLGEEDELTSTELQTEAGSELEDDDTNILQSRRSGRAPRTSLRATPSSISIRRQGGDTECVALRKSEAQQLALLTRSNTRRNKGGAVHARVMLLRLKPGVPGESFEGESPSAASLNILGKVRWNETLSTFFDESKNDQLVSANTEALKAEDEAVATRPRAKRSRALGAANGTPAKPRMKDVDASNATPLSIVPAVPRSKRKTTTTETTNSKGAFGVAPSTATSISTAPALPKLTLFAPSPSDITSKPTRKLAEPEPVAPSTSTQLPKPTKKTARAIPTPAKRKAAPSLLAQAAASLAATPQIPQPVAMQPKPTPRGLAARNSRRQAADQENRDPGALALNSSKVTEAPGRSILPRRGVYTGVKK